MKKCPTCYQIFGDENDFCLNDGTPLVTEYVSGSRPSGEMPTQFIPRQRNTVAPPSGNSSNLLYLVIGVLATALVGVGLYLFLGRSADKSVENSDKTKEVVKMPTQAETSNAPAPVSRSPELTSASPQPESPKLASYPATKRLVFVRGAISTGFAGDLNPNGGRSLVLGCRYGQQLTANISSPQNCVTFGGGGTSYSSITNSGDNFLRLTNRCNSVVRFKIDITII